MGFEAKILADSLSTAGVRLTTMQVTYPRIVHAEHLRHRVFSFSVASTRAIPVARTLAKVKDDPFIPVYWGKNQPGMVAEEEMSPEDAAASREDWLFGRDQMVLVAERLAGRGAHKQIAGRVLELFQFVTVIVSGTEWENFFNLRCHPDAQPEIRKIAEMSKVLYDTHKPAQLSAGMWHIPMCADKMDLVRAGYPMEDILKIAAGRIARVSYETHEGKRDPNADLELANRLKESFHWSPMEHVARAEHHTNFVRNFKGWTQLRVISGG